MFSHVNHGNLFGSYTVVSQGKKEEEKGIEEKSERFREACLSCEDAIRELWIVATTEMQCFTEGPTDNAVWTCIDQRECQNERVKYNKVGEIE